MYLFSLLHTLIHTIIYYLFRILRDILHECNRIVSTKLACTITNAEKIAMHLKKIEETRDEVNRTISFSFLY